jgi:hypothetical protein
MLAPLRAIVSILAMLAFMGPLAASPVSAQTATTYHGFVMDEFYLGHGGTPATFEQVATNPMSVFRSRTAFDTLKTHFSGYLGRLLSDEEFRVLLLSNDVRLVPCVGRIDTAGITNTGRVGWRERNCYRGESLIQLRINGGWVTVASQGCFNPVRGDMPPPPPLVISVSPPPPAPVPPRRERHCHVVQTPNQHSPDDIVSVPGFLFEADCDRRTIYVPGMTANFGGSNGSGYYLVCHEVDVAPSEGTHHED